MKCKRNKITKSFLICVFSILICNMTFAHSGKTDSSGGHRDNNNKSGLGSYHYHCGGYPAHLHTNGVCPYSSSSSGSTQTSSSKSSSKSSTSEAVASQRASTVSSSIENEKKIEKEVPPTIEAEVIEIKNEPKELKVGESQKLTANILPENTTNKDITWKSNDESVIIVSQTGEIKAISEGKANITVSTSNKKTDTITILVTKEEEIVSNTVINEEEIFENDEENIETIDNIMVNEIKENNVNSISNESSESFDPIGTLISFGTLGAIGAGSYLGYKKNKK